MTNTPHPTGRREERDGTSWVVLTRTFRATAADVWAAATDPERMQRWIGTWSGDPESGVVMFRMTAEGEDAPEERVSIDVCDPPFVIGRERTICPREAGGRHLELWINHLISLPKPDDPNRPPTFHIFEWQGRSGEFTFEVESVRTGCS